MKTNTMTSNDFPRNKFALFEQFENTLSVDQRQFLLQNPDLISSDLVGVLYQAAFNRIVQQQFELDSIANEPVVKEQSKVTERKPRKVVNSWMAFRSYYAPLIKDLPQKSRSPMLALLWKHDVDHSLWELLSVAFSYVRDNHSEDGVTLDQFLPLAAQIVPIIPPDQYFARHGWKRVDATLRKVDVQPKELPKATNVSFAGLARFCFRQGLISHPPTTKYANPKPSKNRRVNPSRISFAAISSSAMAKVFAASRDSEDVSPEAEKSEEFRCDDGDPTDHRNYSNRRANVSLFPADGMACPGYDSAQAETEANKIRPDFATDAVFGFDSSDDFLDQSAFLADEFWSVVE